jgi:uncharacterized membrane protein YdbT with pleckstrin-like domain
MKFKLHWVVALQIALHWLLALLTLGLWLPVAINRSLYWYFFEQGLGENGLYVRTGIIARNIHTIHLRSVESIAVEQGFWERLIKLGRVAVKGQGNNAILLINLHDPASVADAVHCASL